jgi:hypothetical protein
LFSRSLHELNLTCNAMLGPSTIAYTPYMDPDLQRFSWSVPVDVVDETFHNAVIDHAFPEYADIAYLPKRKPKPSRGYLREVNRDLLRVLRNSSDGSLVDRPALTRRAALGSVRGDAWFTWGRRANLTTYLVQIESIVSGRGPGAFAGD